MGQLTRFTPCPSTARAVLGAVDPDGALLRCGMVAGHVGDHEFKMTWGDPDPTVARVQTDEIAAYLASRRDDPGDAVSTPLEPAFDMIGGPECPICLGLGIRCRPDGGLIECVEGCDRCDSVIESRAAALGPIAWTDEGVRRIAADLGLVPPEAGEPSGVARLVEVLAGHRAFGDDDHGIEECGCGWRPSETAWEEDWADAIEHEAHVAAVIAREWLPAQVRAAEARALREYATDVDREAADDVARRARNDVRCLSCNLRYEERQDYGCHEPGRGHHYDGEELEEAGTPLVEATYDGDRLRDRADRIEGQ